MRVLGEAVLGCLAVASGQVSVLPVVGVALGHGCLLKQGIVAVVARVFRRAATILALEWCVPEEEKGKACKP